MVPILLVPSQNLLCIDEGSQEDIACNNNIKKNNLVVSNAPTGQRKHYPHTIILWTGLFSGRIPGNRILFSRSLQGNRSLFSGSLQGKRSLFYGRLPGNNGLFSGRGERGEKKGELACG